MDENIEKKLKKFKIFGIDFYYRLINDNYSTNKNISINNENFGLFGRFLKLFEAEIIKIRKSSLLTKDIFSIDFNNIDLDGNLFKVNEQLSIKQNGKNNFILYFNDFKDLSTCLIQFNNGTKLTENLTQLKFNYNLLYNSDLKQYDRMLLDFDSDDIKNIDLIII